MLVTNLLNRLGIGRQPPVPGIKARDDANVDLVLPWALAKAGGELQFPVAYVEFLRTCLERKTFRVTPVKKNLGGKHSDHSKRFASLLNALGNLPPLELAAAEQLARIADSFRANPSPRENDQWSGDVRAHFEMSSTFGHKGRVLTAIVRYMRCTQCLELGTAYGMSALFMLEALSAQGADTGLTTVEGTPMQHQIASQMLASRYGSRARCEQGWTTKVLPRLAESRMQVNFMFHDAGHSRKDYVDDFHAALPLLAPGAVVLFDDINWDDPRFSSSRPQCRKGWLEVAGHARVRWAVEVGQEMGLVLLDVGNK